MAILRAFKPLFASCGGILLAACSYNSAIPQEVRVAQASPLAQEPGGLITIANEMAAKGDHEGAIPLFRHLATTTRTPQALTGLADSLLAMGNLESAYQILADLIAYQANNLPDNLPGTTYYSYGKAALALGDFNNALDGFTRAAVLLPADPRPKSGKAIALAATGDIDAAIAALQGATDPSSLSNKALVLAATGKADAAIEILEPLLRGGSAHARDRQNLAMAYLLDGQEERAFQVARLDLDAASVNETFTFYRSLAGLAYAERMQALVTGTIDPEWTKGEVANLSLEETNGRQVAAQRMVVSDPEPILAKASVPPKPMIEKKVTRANYKPGDVPPLLEPEGWALQIGAYRSLKRLTAGWAILYERNIDILKDIPPRRSERDFGSRSEGPSGFYFRLNAGPLKTLAEARMLCTELRNRGTSCWIRPPETSEGKLPTRQQVQSAQEDQTAEKTEIASR